MDEETDFGILKVFIHDGLLTGGLKVNLNRMLATGMACLLAGTVLIGCSGSESAAGGTPSERESAAIGDDEVLATIGDEQVTMEDVRREVGDDLDQLEAAYLRQQNQLVEETLEKLINGYLLQGEADRRGITVHELLRTEINDKIQVTEQEIAEWYEQNRAQTRGRSLEEAAPQIEDLLRDNREKELRDSLMQALMAGQNVVYHLEPYRVELDNEGAPSLGPADAKVTLVEFSDFECPFCGRFFPTLKRLEREYGDSVRIVYRQFPIPSIHPNAFKAAEASLCAHEQGQFWAMHDTLFEDQERLEVKDLKEHARELGLDGDDFDACLDSGRYVERIQADMREGRLVGVTGTPALFVNGIQIPGGAVPYEVVAERIDEELRRSGG